VEAKTITLNQLDIKKHTLYYLGDIHEGAANFDDKAFEKAVKLIESDADAWIGLGDYVDAINYHDKRFNPHEIANRYSIRDLDDLPKVQSDAFLDNIKPIKDKCVGLLYGNHEDTYRQHNTFDVVKYMSDAIKTANFKHKAWVTLNFVRSRQGTPIKISMCHGKGGGGIREGYPLNRCYDTFRWDMADIHIMGHLHRMIAKMSHYNRYEYGVLRKDPVWFGVNGCFLAKSTEGNDGYFEQSSGEESSIGLIKQTIVPANGKSGFQIKLQTIYL